MSIVHKVHAIGEFGFPELPENLSSYDYQEIKKSMIRVGWRTPNTYDNHWKEPEDVPALYIFMMVDRNCFEDCAVAYVGMSQAVKTRWQRHPTLREIEETDFYIQKWFLEYPSHLLRDAERELIQQFNPPWNIQGRMRGLVN